MGLVVDLACTGGICQENRTLFYRAGGKLYLYTAASGTNIAARQVGLFLLPMRSFGHRNAKGMSNETANVSGNWRKAVGPS
jgi:hypothetical protein